MVETSRLASDGQEPFHFLRDRHAQPDRLVCLSNYSRLELGILILGRVAGALAEYKVK